MKGLRIALVLAALAACPVASAAGTLVVPPRTFPGPYAVGCSDLAQDFTRVAPSEDVQDFWEGVPRSDGSPRYITNLLSDAANTLAATVIVPADSTVYGSFAGQSIPYVILVCYPTAADNPRVDYPLPNGKTIPRMQQGGVAPIFPDATTKFPVLLFSHGYLGSPTSNDYIDAVALLASYGYVVAAPFHGDGRFGSLQLDSLSDLAYVLVHLRDFLGMQAVRALSLSATLDVLLANPQWSTHIDPVQIGGFGASLGGESLLLMAGAGLTTSVGLSWTEITTDRRLKAAVGYVPYFGNPIFPAFGRDEHGLDNVALPYLAIGGTADTTAPIAETAVGLLRLPGPRELVALTGVKHGFDVTSAPDIFTWALTFLDAELRGDADARALLPQIASVAGGGDDHVTVPLAPPAPVNYGGLWWKSPPGSESGWGMNLAHQGDDIFTTWFTYDGTGNGLLARDARQQDAGWHLPRHVCTNRTALPIPRRRSTRLRSSPTRRAPERSRLPTPTTARSPIRWTTSRNRSRSRGRSLAPFRPAHSERRSTPRAPSTCRTSGGRIPPARSRAGAST